MSTVDSLMTANPASCSPETPIRHVAQLMIDNDCGQIPVVDASGKPVGVVTDRDIAVRLVAAGKSEATAADAMTSPCRSVAADSSVQDAVKMMEDGKIRRVPVVDGAGKLAGIVSIADLALAGKQEATAQVVKQVSEPGAK
ncbi:CBS domain-containing protein [Pseudoluteimonas lycopersici]|uniref:CBS domain-containing protein n=1 Tax=Pseudoluteimonas lycopersici TaxID=1324796 RepID=A0A516V3C6_9GAMM|nr:CBS domain-containing protein [Lysobacter lycopersici]QDQ73031.1 CBS domain-containing protein [Lysobacter lycopersici]